MAKSMKTKSGGKGGHKLSGTATGTLGSIKPALFTGRVATGKGR